MLVRFYRMDMLVGILDLPTNLSRHVRLAAVNIKDVGKLTNKNIP